MKPWLWYKNAWWILKEKTQRLYRRITMNKCEGCDRLIEKPYRWCSIECFCYCGGTVNYKKDNK